VTVTLSGRPQGSVYEIVNVNYGAQCIKLRRKYVTRVQMQAHEAQVGR